MIKDLTQGSSFGLLIRFALPIMIGNMFQQAYSIVGSIIVGRYVGEDALAAVGTTGNITGLILVVLTGATAGMAVVIAQYFGHGDMDSLKKAVATSAYILIIVSIAVTFGGLILAKPLLRLINVPEQILPASVSYMSIILIGTIATAFYNGSAAMLRSLGNSLVPLVFLVISSILNIVFGLVFVAGLELGINGMAWATVIAECVSAITCTMYMWIKVPMLRFGRKEFVPDKTIARAVIRLGIPSALLGSTINIGMIMIQGLVNSYGIVIMAAYTAANRLERMFASPASAVGHAMQVYTGQNVGANNYKRVSKGFKSGMKIVLIINVIAMVFMAIFGRNLMSLFVVDQGSEVVEVGYTYILMITGGLPIVSILLLTRSTLTGAGDAWTPLVMGIFELISRFICSYFLSIPFGYIGVFLGTPLAWVTACTLALIRYKRKRWMTKRVVPADF